VNPSPCPFCGDQPLYRKRRSDHSKTREWHVFLCYCGEVTACVWKAADSRAVALEAWNRRSA